MIVGLAGHVDHGKSTLVTALTGVATDRAPEARRRGITIDLQAVALRNGAGEPIAALIDVPGHEDFVRAMVAGCSGVGAILLVVAADDGVMPQTREHLQIAERLGVPRGIAVITKSDLAAADWLQLVTEEVAALCAASPIVFDGPIAVSASRGDGVAGVRAALEVLAGQAGASPGDDLFRMPIDKIFHRPGFGTIVTGTAWSGRVATGDHLLLLPSGREARVRGIEVHGGPAGAATSGQRVALALTGVPHEVIARGETVVHPDAGWFATIAADVEVGLDPGVAPIGRTRRVVAHAGTAAVPARITAREEIAGGGHSLARLRFDRPVVLRGGDRIILRTPSPAATIGGAVVLDPDPPRRSPVPGDLQSDQVATRLGALVARRRSGLPVAALPILVGAPPSSIASLCATAGVHVTHGRCFAPDAWQGARQAALAALSHPEPGGADGTLSVETLRRRVASRGQRALADAVIEQLVAAGEVARDGDRVMLPGAVLPAGPSDEEIDQVVAALAADGLAAPPAAILAARLAGVDVAAVCRLAEARGLLVAVERGRWVTAAALAGFAAVLADIDRTMAHGGEITVAMARDRTGLSRRYLLPALEWADRSGVTWRTGEGRRLARRSP